MLVHCCFENWKEEECVIWSECDFALNANWSSVYAEGGLGFGFCCVNAVWKVAESEN